MAAKAAVLIRTNYSQLTPYQLAAAETRQRRTAWWTASVAIATVSTSFILWNAPSHTRAWSRDHIYVWLVTRNTIIRVSVVWVAGSERALKIRVFLVMSTQNTDGRRWSCMPGGWSCTCQSREWPLTRGRSSCSAGISPYTCEHIIARSIYTSCEANHQMCARVRNQLWACSHGASPLSSSSVAETITAGWLSSCCSKCSVEFTSSGVSSHLRIEFISKHRDDTDTNWPTDWLYTIRSWFAKSTNWYTKADSVQSPCDVLSPVLRRPAGHL